MGTTVTDPNNPHTHGHKLELCYIVHDEPPSRRVIRVEDCSTCARIKTVYDGFGPPHDASPSCESGKHPHCSCDTCF